VPRLHSPRGRRWRARPAALAPEPPSVDDAGLEDLERAVRGVLAFVRRRLTGDYDVDVYGFDRELTEQVSCRWRGRCTSGGGGCGPSGLEHVPDEGGALLVANHAGTVPFDAVMTKVALSRRAPGHRHLRELAADLALRVPIIGPLARKTGNTLAHTDDARRTCCESGELVGVWPEGFKGIGKHYRDRYKLQRFGRGGFVEVALRAGVPIIPVAIIGSEEIYPMMANVKFAGTPARVPVLPGHLAVPAAGPARLVPLPSKWVIEFGEPIDTDRPTGRRPPTTRCWCSS
jgi:1-acyl-sn-glycerol-3-phosphate acyltransferase